jgi:hypothetical protein
VIQYVESRDNAPTSATSRGHCGCLLQLLCELAGLLSHRRLLCRDCSSNGAVLVDKVLPDVAALDGVGCVENITLYHIERFLTVK